MYEQITVARFIHPNQIRVLELLGEPPEEISPSSKVQQRRANRFLLATFSMSGKNSPRCRRLIRSLEQQLGDVEADLVRQEIYDAIFDLSPLNRQWI